MKRGDSGFSEGSAGNNVATSLASQLPFELLMNVFRRTLSVRDLVVCANVCVNWHSTATTLLWRKPIFASLDSFTRFTRCCSNASLVAPSLRALALEPGEKAEWVVSGERQWLGCLGITRLVFLHFNQVPFLAAFVQPLHIACIAEARPLLSRLDLSNCIQIGDAPLAQIVSVCASSLQHLSLNGCRLVTDAGIAIMSQFCGPFKLLHTLSMRGCGLISDLGISEISKSGLASCLTSFDVSGCYRVTDRGVYRFLDKAVKEASAAQKDSLEERDAMMDSDDAAKLIQQKERSGLGRLTEFRFSGSQTGSRKFTRNDFERILSLLVSGHAVNTLEFSIPPPPKGSDSTVYRSFPFHLLKSITSLHIYDATYLLDDSIMILAKSSISAQLHSLTITESQHISEIALCSLLSSLPNIVFLALHNSGINTTALGHLVNSAPFAHRLKHLDLRACKHLQDLSILQFCIIRGEEAAGATPPLPLPSLETLNLAACRNLTFDGILPVIQSYAPRADGSGGRLVHLDITGTLVDTRSWPRFVEQCEAAATGGVFSESARFSGVPEFAGIDGDSFEREFVLGVDIESGSGDVWVLKPRDEDWEEMDDMDVDLGEEQNAGSKGKVFLLKDPECGEILREWRLRCIAKHATSVLGEL